MNENLPDYTCMYCNHSLLEHYLVPQLETVEGIKVGFTACKKCPDQNVPCQRRHA